MKLHEYQQNAIQFIEERPACALFADMGLGKTVMCLEALNGLFRNWEIKGVLIVAPKRVMNLTWPIEINNYSPCSWMSYQILHGPNKLQNLKTPAHLYLINYEGLLWLSEQIDPIPTEEWPFDTIIYDETTKMKNPSSQRFKGKTVVEYITQGEGEPPRLRNRRIRGFKHLSQKFKRRIGLTGTPTPKSMLDLWSQMYLLDGGQRLDTAYTRYKKKYFYPTDYNGYNWEAKEGSTDQIQTAISDITLRISEKGNLSLPPVSIEDVELALPPKYRKQYDVLEKHMFLQLDTGGKIDVKFMAALSNKCLQYTGGNVYTTLEGDWERVHDVKLKALKTIYEEEDSPLLIAYNYLPEAKRIKELFPEAEILSSKLSAKREREIQAQWDRRELPILICHPASAGHGLNLQKGGHRAVWYTLNWSLEYYLQLNKRLHRQGQKNPVTIYRLIMTDTIDEVVSATLENKQTNQQYLLDALERYKQMKGA